jgi:glycosyltransferase involved in cell wall biosynthesis
MRIGMFLDTSFPPDSRVENEAFSLIADGHEVFLFSLNFKNLQPEQENVNGIKLHRYAANKLLFKASALAYPLPLFQMLVKPMIEDFIKRYQPQALHVHDMLLARAVMQVNKQLQLPLTLDLHENRPEIMRYYPHLQRFPGKFLIKPTVWAKAQRRLMKEADKVVLVTEEAREVAVLQDGITKEKIIVVPNTIHPEIFYQYPIEEQLLEKFRSGFNIVYAGDTGLRRGTDTAIRAVALLKKDIPEIRLVLVGKSTEDVRLKTLARELQVEDKVFFEGWQAVSLFPTYFKLAQLCISPIKRNPHHDTTFANKIFQYMAMGKPLLVSDCPPQLRVVVEEVCGMVHEADNAHDMAGKILYLYRNKQLREEMGENARRAVQERWNWQYTSRDLLRLYRTLSSENCEKRIK